MIVVVVRYNKIALDPDSSQAHSGLMNSYPNSTDDSVFDMSASVDADTLTIVKPAGHIYETVRSLQNLIDPIINVHNEYKEWW